MLKDRQLTNWSFAYDIVAERIAADGAHELLELDIIEVGPTLKGANSATYTISAKTSTSGGGGGRRGGGGGGRGSGRGGERGGEGGGGGGKGGGG